MRILAGPGQSLQLVAFRDTLDSWLESGRKFCFRKTVSRWFLCHESIENLEIPHLYMGYYLI